MNIKYSAKIVLFLILISCKNNGQDNPKNKEYENSGTKMKTSDNYKLSETSKEDIFDVQKFLKSKNFKKLDDTSFKNKIIEKFGINIDTINKSAQIYEEATLDPHIFTEAILYTTAYRENKFLVPVVEDFIEPFFSDRTKFDDFPRERKDILYHFNNWILHDDKASFAYLKGKKPWTFMHMIHDYAYTGNDDYIKFILNGIGKEREAQEDIDEMVISWAPMKNRSEIRRNVVEKILEFRSDLAFNIGMIISNYDDYKIKSAEANRRPMYSYETEKQKLEDFSYLMNIVIEQGLVGIIDELYNEDPMVLGLLKDNDFYGYKELKDYSLKVYGQKPYDDENPKPVYDMAVINDPDGYTNVRDTSGEVAFKIMDGEKFMISKSNKEVIGEFYKDDWWYVSFKGKNGWIHKSRVKVISE